MPPSPRPQVIHALLTQRAALTSIPAGASAVSIIDAGIAELPLAAARAADPAFAADALLISMQPTHAAATGQLSLGVMGGGMGGGGMGGGAPSNVADWPAALRHALTIRLRCYGLLLSKLDLLAAPGLPPAPKASDAPNASGTPNDSGNGLGGAPGAPAAAAVSAATSPAAGAWLRVLEHALKVQPSDALFHHAAFLHLLHAHRETPMLRLPSPHLIAFATTPPLTDGARQVWSRFLQLRAPEELTSLEQLLAAPPSPQWPVVERTLASGALLPRLHFDSGRFVDAATAFAELAERPDPAAPPPPVASDAPLPPSAAALGGGAAAAPPPPLSHAQLGERQRALETRISHISMALAAASGAGGAASTGLGADFVRTLEENAQRGQLQLRLATEIAKLLTSDERLHQLLPYMPAHPDVGSLAAALDTFHAQVCGNLLELLCLFKVTWAARLWWPLLAVLDFARPYREYPLYVTQALQHLLGQPPEVWASGHAVAAPPVNAPTRSWADLTRDIGALRKSFTNGYIFQPDVIVASLEAHQLLLPRAEGGAVVRLLCSHVAAHVRPPVAWEDVYACYGSSERCGPLMRTLWEGGRPALGSTGKQKLHLIAGLATLLSEWLEESRAPKANRGCAHQIHAQRPPAHQIHAQRPPAHQIHAQRPPAHQIHAQRPPAHADTRRHALSVAGLPRLPRPYAPCSLLPAPCSLLRPHMGGRFTLATAPHLYPRINTSERVRVRALG